MRNKAKCVPVVLALLLCAIAGGCAAPQPSAGTQKETSAMGGLEIVSDPGGEISLSAVSLSDGSAASMQSNKDGQLLTATVKSDGGVSVDMDVTWDFAWENPASEWATGKDVTEYFSLTPLGESGEDGRKAFVACLQAFGEKIVITCAAKTNPSKQASAVAHYVQKAEDLTLNFGDIEVDFETGLTQIPFSAENPASAAPAGRGNLKFSAQSSTPYTTPLEISCVANFNTEIFKVETEDSTRTRWMFGTKDAGDLHGMTYTPFDATSFDPIKKGLPNLLYWLETNLVRVVSGRGGQYVYEYTREQFYADYQSYGTTAESRKLYELTFTFSCPEAGLDPVSKTTAICIREFTGFSVSSVNVDKDELYF